MATETVASDHTSTTDEQFVKKEKDEGIAEKIASLANDKDDKHDKPVDEQDQATPSSKTNGEAAGEENKAEPEAEKSEDSPALEASSEDNVNHDKAGDTQIPEAEADDKKAEPDVVVEKTEDSVSLEAYVADTVKEEKELIPDSKDISVTEPAHDTDKSQPEEPPSTEPIVEETPQQPEKESTETEEEKKSEPAEIPEPEVEKSSDMAEANPLKESESEVVKEGENAQKEEKAEPEPVATEVKETSEEQEKESQEKPQEAEQTSTDAIPEPDAIEEKTREASAEVLEETINNEAGFTETEKAEDAVTEVVENPKEPEKQSLEQKEEEKPNTVAIPEPSAETSDAIEEKTREPELQAEESKETNNYEAGPTETEKADPEVPEVKESLKEPEKQSLEQKEEEKPNTVAVPEASAQTGDAIEEKTREAELETEVWKETNNSETGLAEPETTESVVTKVDENPSEPEKQPSKQEEEEKPKEEVVPETAAVSTEKPGDVVEVHPPKDSDTEVVKETINSESEAVPVKEEKPEPVSTEVEKKPKEQLEVAEKFEETGKEVNTKQETALENAKIEGTSDDTIKEPITLKDEKTEKEEETSIMENAAKVSLNGEAQEAPANLLAPSTEVAEKVAEENGKKESSFTNKIEEVSREVADTIKIPEQEDSNDQEAKTGSKEGESSVLSAVEEKVAAAVAVNDDKKEPDAVQESSREAKVEIKKVEEQNEAKVATTEAGVVKVESVEGDKPAVDNEKQVHADTKVEEISSAVSGPVRETLASKFEEKEEEPTKTEGDNLEKEQSKEPVKAEVQDTKDRDATKTSKDLPKETPAKPAQKQSNNIISKVKQSLVKAKKAITGKSPSSKNLSTEAKGDIKVK